ncbi:hypothetical protein FQA47_002245 [Oryzias melastigma]|uniref:Uncharacterized protein n=1 Tax=Oryzias melastigma TaxID=30732 RepID=A0A834FAI7_ORYME|nr:hypothetical protein FQA47_002245 [Oryzias melastigma]
MDCTVINNLQKNVCLVIVAEAVRPRSSTTHQSERHGDWNTVLNLFWTRFPTKPLCSVTAAENTPKELLFFTAVVSQRRTLFGVCLMISCLFKCKKKRENHFPVLCIGLSCLHHQFVTDTFYVS